MNNGKQMEKSMQDEMETGIIRVSGDRELVLGSTLGYPVFGTPPYIEQSKTKVITVIPPRRFPHRTANQG